MGLSWNFIKNALSDADVAFLRQMAVNAYGSGKDEGQNGGAGYIGLFNGRMIKFNTHAKDRILPEFFMSGESKTASQQVYAKLQEIINKVDRYARKHQDSDAHTACEKLLKDLGGEKNTSLLTRKIAATTLKGFGGDDLWKEVTAGKNMATLSTKDIETTFDKVKETTVSEVSEKCREKCQVKIDAAILTLTNLGVLSDLEEVANNREGGAVYIDRMKHVIEQTVDGLRTLPDEIARACRGELGPLGRDPFGAFLNQTYNRNRDWLKKSLRERQQEVEFLRYQINDEILGQIDEIQQKIDEYEHYYQYEQCLAPKGGKEIKAEMSRLNKKLLDITLKMNPEKPDPELVKQMSEYSQKISELKVKLFNPAIQRTFEVLLQKRDNLKHQLAEKTKMLTRREVELAFAKGVKAVQKVVDQLGNDEDMMEWGYAFSVKDKPGDKRKLDKISEEALVKLDTFRMFREDDAVTNGSEGHKFETGSVISKMRYEDCFRGPKLLNALSTIIKGKKGKTNTVVSKEDGTGEGDNVAVLKVSDLAINFGDAEEEDDDEVLEREPKKTLEEKRLEFDIRQGVKRYETRVRGLPVKGYETTDEQTKIKTKVEGIDDKLKMYKIPQEYQAAFYDLFKNGEMTILEREAINEILSEYGMKI